MVQQRLLDIAIEAFGRNGLDGASTREIARAAGTAMSSITYHYGGKEGLYLAAADYIAEEMGATMAPVFTIEVADGDRQAAREAIHSVLDALLAKFIDQRSEGWSLFIVREQMHPTEAFNRIFDGPMGQMMRRLVRFVCIAVGIDDSEAARITAMTLFGQVLVVRASNAAVLRMLETPSIDPALAGRISARIRANTNAILDAMTAEQEETR